MAFTVEDFQDLVRLLAQHPEWRSELRRLLLSEELLTVPERLARVERLLAELVQRDEERSRQLAGLIEAVRENTRQIAELRETVAEHSRQIAELRETVAEHSRQIAELRETVAEHSRQIAELRETVAEHSRQIAELRETVAEHSRQIAELRETVAEHSRQIAELRETVAEHSRQIAELRETVAEHSRQIAEQTRQIEGLRETVLLLAQRLDTVAGRMDMALGELLELRAERRLSSWLGRFLRGLRVRPPGEWEREFRPLLSPAAFDRLLDADLLARGRLTFDGQREVWLAIEVSRVIDAEDVARAQEWAQLLREVGLVAVPVVLGAALTGEAREAVERERVLFVEATLQRVWVHGWEAVRERWVA
jgi:uncharacterized coiled-coil DUF342 family protein